MRYLYRIERFQSIKSRKYHWRLRSMSGRILSTSADSPSRGHRNRVSKNVHRHLHGVHPEIRNLGLIDVRKSH